LVAVDSLSAPASSQFGAPPFLPNAPLFCPSSPKPSGSIKDDNFDSSIPPDDCHMASNDDSSAFDYPYGDKLSSNLLPIEHHPDFSNVGAHLKLGKESNSIVISNNDDDDDDDDDHDIHHGDHDDHFSSSPFHVDDLPTGLSAFSGFVQPSLPDNVHVINDSRLQPANEALLSLIIDNNLPQEMYNNILDWAHFARLSEYNIPMAIEHRTSLHRMHSKYANVCGGPHLSEIVRVPGYQPIHGYCFDFLCQAKRLYLNKELMANSL
jgi:hypothetical protein